MRILPLRLTVKADQGFVRQNLLSLNEKNEVSHGVDQDASFLCLLVHLVATTQLKCSNS